MAVPLRRGLERLLVAASASDNEIKTLVDSQAATERSLSLVDQLLRINKGIGGTWEKAKRALRNGMELEKSFSGEVQQEADGTSSFSIAEAVTYPINQIEAGVQLYEVQKFMRANHMGDEPFAEGLGLMLPAWLRQVHRQPQAEIPQSLRGFFSHPQDSSLPTKISTFEILRAFAKVRQKEKRSLSDEGFVFLSRICGENLENAISHFQNGVFVSFITAVSPVTLDYARFYKKLTGTLDPVTHEIVHVIHQYFFSLQRAFFNEDSLLHEPAYNYFSRIVHNYKLTADEKEFLLSRHIGGFFENEKLTMSPFSFMLVRGARELAKEEPDDPVIQQYARLTEKTYDQIFRNQVHDPNVLTELFTIQPDVLDIKTELSTLMRESFKRGNSFLGNGIMTEVELNLIFSGFRELRYTVMPLDEWVSNIQIAMIAKDAAGQESSNLKFSYLLLSSEDQSTALFVSPDQPNQSAATQELLLTLARRILAHELRPSQVKKPVSVEKPQAEFKLAVQQQRPKGPEQTSGSGRKRKHKIGKKSGVQELLDEQPTPAEQIQQSIFRPKLTGDIGSMSLSHPYTVDFLAYCKDKLDRWNTQGAGIFKAMRTIIGPNEGTVYTLRAGRNYRIMIEAQPDGSFQIYDILPRSKLS